MATLKASKDAFVKSAALHASQEGDLQSAKSKLSAIEAELDLPPVIHHLDKGDFKGMSRALISWFFHSEAQKFRIFAGAGSLLTLVAVYFFKKK